MMCKDCSLFDTSGRDHENDRDGLCRWRPSDTLIPNAWLHIPAPLTYDFNGDRCPQFKERPHA